MKGMRKLSITATAMVAAAVMALAGCGSSGTADSAASGSSGSAKSDTFMAAGLFPLTGSMAYLGPANIATMKLAQKDINAAGGVLGKDIEITSADTSDADHADQNTSSAQSVLAKNPSVVVGPPSSSVVKNTYKQVTSAKVPMISSGATSTAFSGLSDYFFRTIPPDTVQGAVLGQIIAQDGVKNLAIAVFNDEYGTSLRDVVVKTVEDAGVNVVYGEKDTFDPTETNFSSMVTAIKATNPDAIYYGGMDAQAGPMARQMQKLGIKAKLFGSDGLYTPVFLQLSGDAGEGQYSSQPGAPRDKLPGYTSVEEKLKAKTGAGVVLYSTYAYDAARVLVDAMKRADSVDPAKYLPAVQQSKFNGATGLVEFDEAGNRKNGAVTIYQVRNCQWEIADVVGGGQ